MFILSWIAPLKTKYSLLHVKITVFELYILYRFSDKGHVFTNSFPPKLRYPPEAPPAPLVETPMQKCV